MAKKITNENLLGQRGINLIEQCVLGMGCAWHPSNQAVEAGIDGYIELRNPDTRHALNLVVAVQSKARSEFAGETVDSATFYCEPRDIDYWLQGNLPVVVVVSRPDTRDAFWVDVKRYFQDAAARQSRKIVFNKSRDRLDTTARSRFFDIARPRDSGLYLAPLPRPETLCPNLLKIRLPTDEVWFADTTLRDPKQIIDALQGAEPLADPGWLLAGGRVVSFQPLDRPPWDGVCSLATTLTRPTADLAGSDDPDETRLFVRLLNRCLEARCRPHGIRFDRRLGLYHFVATADLKTRTISFRSAARQSARAVFEAYRHRETDQVRYCRHLAFEGYFRRLGAAWYLEVTPTYRFTRDGRAPDRFADDHLKGIKRLDRNKSVYGQLLTWVDVLTHPGDMYQPDYPHLAFERPAGLPLGTGIDDDAWLGVEDAEAAARLRADVTPTVRLFDS